MRWDLNLTDNRIGRETFLTTLEWKDDWPILNSGEPILLSASFGTAPDQSKPQDFVDTFSKKSLDPSWYQLRIPYTQNFRLGASKSKHACKGSGLTFVPNVFSLSERDTPAAILRKQTSLNMTFSARLLPTNGSLNYRQSVGISAYLSEFQHEDIGVKGCTNHTGLCLYSQLRMNTTTSVSIAILLLQVYQY